MRLPAFSFKRLTGVGALGFAATLGSVAALAAAASPAAGSAVAASTPACQTAGLVVWLNTSGNGAAGSIFYTMNFTNLSGHACTLRGYPGVSAVNLRGKKVGSAASRDNSQKVKTVKLGKGATATATLRIVETGNFSPSACGPRTAAGLRVYPPNQTASALIPFPFSVCSHGPASLSIRAVTK
jgi:hypothetical protein